MILFPVGPKCWNDWDQRWWIYLYCKYHLGANNRCDKNVPCLVSDQLTHWGRVTHICVGNLTSIDSDNGLSPERRQAITWTNDRLLLIGSLGTNFSEMLFGIRTFSFKKMHFKMSSGKWRPFCLGLNELIQGLQCCCLTPSVMKQPACRKNMIRASIQQILPVGCITQWFSNLVLPFESSEVSQNQRRSKDSWAGIGGEHCGYYHLGYHFY